MGNYNETIDQITQQLGRCEPPSPEARPRGLPKEQIENLWSLMANMFGHKWVSSYGREPDPDRIWSATLYDLSEPQIRAGLRALADSGAEWPPSAPEFRQLCLNPGGELWETRRIQLADQERAMMLPAPVRHKDVGARALANIWGILG